jgi:hypothetical protein
MTKFSINRQPPKTEPTEKYVKQTNDAMSNVNTNLEMVALQITQLPIREQNKFLRLLINVIDITASKARLKHQPIGLKDSIEVSQKIMDTVNLHYEEQESL